MDELKIWEKEKGASEPNLIVFSDGDAETHKNLELNAPILLDKNYKTAEKLGMAGTPSAVLIDENGVIVSETAIGAGNIWALIGKRK
jgi:protein-disulfide isomerase